MILLRRYVFSNIFHIYFFFVCEKFCLFLSLLDIFVHVRRKFFTIFFISHEFLRVQVTFYVILFGFDSLIYFFFFF